MAEIELQTPQRTSIVRRPHTDTASPLRAWSSADELVLQHLGQDDLGAVLVVNDEFGALTVSLAGARLTSWGDSVLGRLAIAANLQANGLDPNDVVLLRGDELPAGTFDTVIVRVPKTTALLEHQLRSLAGVISADTQVVGTGMARHIHRSTVGLFETLIGPTITSRATRKARLIHSEPASPLKAREISVRPETNFVTDVGVNVAQLPGTFSADHIDVGTALLIKTLAAVPAPASNAQIIDLGCGNGVLATSVALQWGSGRYTMLDVSDLAVAAAQATWLLNDLDTERVNARAADGFEGVQDRSVDMVITNPPFHQGHAIDRDMTDRLLADAARVLKVDGTVYVVAQRHLQLHTRMKRWFGHVETRSKHPSHVVLVATRPKA